MESTRYNQKELTCPYCGADYQQGVITCPKCGKPVSPTGYTNYVDEVAPMLPTKPTAQHMLAEQGVFHTPLQRHCVIAMRLDALRQGECHSPLHQLSSLTMSRNALQPYPSPNLSRQGTGFLLCRITKPLPEGERLFAGCSCAFFRVFRSPSAFSAILIGQPRHRLLQIRQQVISGFDADAEADEVGGDFEGRTLHAGVSHQAGDFDERFDPAEALGEGE